MSDNEGCLSADHVNMVNRKLVDWLRYASNQQGASMSTGGFFMGPRARQVELHLSLCSRVL